jgi:hypothetical protein
VGQDHCQELADFVGGAGRDGAVGVVADFFEVIADIVER